MHRPARRHGPALLLAAVLLGVIGGTSFGLVAGAGGTSTGAAAARGAAAAAAPPSSSRPGAAPPTVTSASRAAAGAPVERPRGAPRRQLDQGVRAERFKQRAKTPGDSGRRSHGKARAKGRRQAH